MTLLNFIITSVNAFYIAPSSLLSQFMVFCPLFHSMTFAAYTLPSPPPPVNNLKPVSSFSLSECKGVKHSCKVGSASKHAHDIHLHFFPTLNPLKGGELQSLQICFVLPVLYYISDSTVSSNQPFHKFEWNKLNLIIRVYIFTTALEKYTTSTWHESWQGWELAEKGN